ncbi:MAG: hypothetical protein A3F84_21750 [Candidatus Handelsmanbacteria bacterium RIFCSPLOWO2_12_FULL_64_10]|uniref:Glycosyl hydrolase-like 10 domain-containing protein n=1 Tax=Handelsmanbacteria sp. (strain RIFCSPLOWO2_12_FULL_64_10) TaxID=1817868 RepID=A0A1F6D7D0_HANXR|nr:MAG: hypothetical protein A3F84_21750 [Candidatus Handelsmanbacteria bacterium RIFCSPLOWO2_12_FULL_64_10]
MAKRIPKAVWSHPGRDYQTGKASVRPMVERLAQAGFELIVPCLKGHGPVSYQSKVAHVADWCKEWDPLAVLAEEAGRAGVKVHAWLCVFTEGEGSALVEKRTDLSALDPEGKKLDWACPRAQEVQDYAFSLYEELMGYDIAGVHLDYIRYGGQNSCYCPRCQRAFSEVHGLEPSRLGVRDALRGDWLAFRAEPVTRFVERLSATVKGRGKELSAAVFPDYPGCYVGVGQDWADWVERGLLDLLLPMNYTISTEVARRRTQAHAAYVKGKVPLYEGLGKTSSHSHLPTKNLVAQVEAVLTAGADGICLFSHGGVTDEDLRALKGF